MAEIEFFFNRKDEELLINKIFEYKGNFIPTKSYDIPKYDIIRLLNTFNEFRDNSIDRQFVIIFDEYYESEFQIDKYISKIDYKIKYSISQKNGGPSLQLSCCRTFTKNNKNYITSGSLGYYDKYWSTKLDDEIRTPDEIRNIYKELGKIVRKNSEKYKALSRIYFIGENLKKEIDNGEIFLPENITEKTMV